MKHTKGSSSPYDIEVFRKKLVSPDRFEDFLFHYQEILGFDWGIKLETAAECAWSAEIRITPDPNHHGTADISTVIFMAGQPGPVEGIRSLVPGTLEVISELLRKREDKERGKQAGQGSRERRV